MTDCSLGSLGVWAARNRRLVVGVWIALLVVATLAHQAVGSTYSDTLTIPGSAAQNGLNVLRAHDPKAGGQDGQLVFEAGSDTKLSANAAAIHAAVRNLAQLPHVLAVGDPLVKGAVAPSGDVAYTSINFDENPQKLGQRYINQVNAAVGPARQAGIRVLYGGALGQAAEPKARDMRSELIGIIVALIVLLAGFGSVYGAGLPLLSAVLAVLTGVGTLGIVAGAVSFGTSAPTLAIMIGLGVGIDYALFMTTRFRQRMIDGDDPEQAIRTTVQASGHSVLIAASTVVIAMLGLYASGISFIGKLGLAAAITVGVAAAAALTLVPALIGYAGRSIDRHQVRSAVAEPSGAGSGMHSYVGLIERHPWRFALGGITLLLVLAVPALSMRVGHVQPSAEPASFSDHQAYVALQSGWGPGADGPLTIVAELPPKPAAPGAGQIDQLERTLNAALSSTPGVRTVTKLRATSDDELIVGKVIPATGPGSSATAQLVHELQYAVLPRALAGSGAKGFVTGTTAASIDFVNTVSSRLGLIIGVVLIAAFVLLLAAFRSPVVALKAVLLNLLSIGAAYGVLVAVFQWGWGSGFLGVQGTVPIESYVPMIIFAIVFGLSMDYEVFLVSRIREHWLRTGDNKQSVATGLGQTARVISCAAVIMASVFFAFLLSTKVDVKMLALGLGFSVLIDASVIRLMIVPSLMFLFDRWNWWAPRWLLGSSADPVLQA
jgi:RND superfamily putative drug exporter